LVGVYLLRLRVECDANAGRYPRIALVNAHRMRGGVEQAREHWHTALNVRQVEQHGDELVATQSGQGVAFA